MRWNPRLVFLFFAPYLLSVILIAFTVVLYTDRALERQHGQTLALALLREVRLVGTALPWDIRGAELEQRCHELAPDPAARLTVIDVDGTVLCDSDVATALMENHLGRPEVQAALQSGEGESVRLSATTGARYMYRAWLQQVGDRRRIIRFALPTTAVSRAQLQIRWILFLSLALAVGAGLWPAVRLSRWLSRRIDTMVAFSQAVAADREPPRLAPERRDHLGRLETNLLTMGGAVSQRLRATREEEQKLRAVLAGMVEGVLVVTERGELVLLNERAREIFGLDPTHEYSRRSIVEICRDPELQQLLRDTIRMPATKARLAREISLTGESPRVLAVNAAPVHGDAAALGYVLVFHEITELKKLEAVRRDFVANVSHELRTPLTAIRGYAETLLSGALDDAQNARKFLGVIERNAERLTRLIDDLLTLSDLELGRLGLQRTAVAVRAAIEAACEVVGEKARRGGVALNHEELNSLPPIDADGDRVEQVLVNLIDNAVKYTPSGGSVSVSARRVNTDDPNVTSARGRSGSTEYVEIAVADTGIGIPSQELPRLTERFYRVDKARSRELGGTGLGLAIVKHIMQVHAGWMRIESDLGRGTTVRVAFPVAPSEARL